MQTLYDQTSNRKLKKDRKKDIKSMEEKVLTSLQNLATTVAVLLLICAILVNRLLIVTYINAFLA